VIHRAPKRVACTYLVTAWPVGGTDLALQEQRATVDRWPMPPIAALTPSGTGPNSQRCPEDLMVLSVA
jgi:hypothetical protein